MKVLALLLVTFLINFASTSHANSVNLGDPLNVVAVVPVTTIAATANGSSVDLGTYDGQVVFLLNSAAGTGNADNTLNIKIQDSADGSTNWNDVSGAAFTQVSTVASVQKLTVNKDYIKRYVRAVKTLGGTTPSFIAGVVLVANKKYQ